MTEYIFIKINGVYYLAQRLGIEKNEGLGELKISRLEILKKFENRQDVSDFLEIMDFFYSDSLKK